MAGETKKKRKPPVKGEAKKTLVELSTGDAYEVATTRVSSKITKEARQKRRVFAAHYVKTTNMTQAAEVAGFKSPKRKGSLLMKEPYVQLLIAERLQQLDHDAIMTQNEILFGLKAEAFDYESGNQGARVKALSEMAKIRNMVIHSHNVTSEAGSGVMIVPAVVSADEWSEMAAKSQAKLKDSVKD